MSDDQVQFVPSRVEGASQVTSVTVYPDRIELASAADVVKHRFADIASWPKPPFLWRLFYSLGMKPRWLPVADRDWFHAPPDRFFLFYTKPMLKVFMPYEDNGKTYESSCFRRVQQVMGQGGFSTFDLG